MSIKIVVDAWIFWLLLQSSFGGKCTRRSADVKAELERGGRDRSGGFGRRRGGYPHRSVYVPCAQKRSRATDPLSSLRHLK